MDRLSGKIAVITGVTGVLGASQARLFAREGAVVLAAGGDAERGAGLVESIAAEGGHAEFLALDAESERSWDALGRAVERRHGGFDILVTNASRTTGTRTEAIGRGDFDRVLATNARAAFFGVRLAVPWMLERGGGSIVHVSSVAGVVPPRDSSEAYAASSGALRSLAKDVSADYSGAGIRCNSVHAGLIGTSFANSDEVVPPDAVARYLEVIPMRRVGTPEEVAGGVLFLASDEASYISGTELIIDGGMVAY